MSLIVALTSTSARLTVLRHTLISLIDQSCKADKIVVCLSKKPYLIDQGIAELPSWLTRMEEESQVEVAWVENTGPYRKLLPTLRHANSDDWIVTCDDDVIYGDGWLASLVGEAAMHPGAIVCGRARRPTKNPFGVTQSYINWPLVPSGSKGMDLVPIGIAGVLYRKDLLDERIVLSRDFLELAPRQDDLWFNLARRLKNASVVVALGADSCVFPIEAPDPLSYANVAVRYAAWDRYFKAMFDRVYIKLKGYLGVPVCGNDIALKKLKEYEKILER